MLARARRRVAPDLAAGLVFVASGAVLVVEILGIRLLAPYVGLTLETTTAIIGAVLGGIAAGAALGGRAADRVTRACCSRCCWPPAARSRSRPCRWCALSGRRCAAAATSRRW